MMNCKSCRKPLEIQITTGNNGITTGDNTQGYHSGLCPGCKELSKAFMMADPVFARLAAELERRFGRIWTD